MTSRDHRAALLGRAEALEREVERLRRENEELRARVEAVRDDVLARHRAEIARLASRAPKPAAARGAPPSGSGRDPSLANKALSWPWSRVVWGVGLGAVLPAVIFGSGQAIFHALSPRSATEHVVATALVVFPVAAYVFGLYVLRVRVIGAESRRERRWLAALEFPFDFDRYFSVLSKAQARQAVEVALRFVRELSEDERQLVAERVRHGSCRIASVCWRDGKLVIASPVLKTRFKGVNGGPPEDNVRIHRWFRRLARAVLTPLARAHPVEDVQLDGVSTRRPTM